MYPCKGSERYTHQITCIKLQSGSGPYSSQMATWDFFHVLSMSNLMIGVEITLFSTWIISRQGQFRLYQNGQRFGHANKCESQAPLPCLFCRVMFKVVNYNSTHYSKKDIYCFAGTCFRLKETCRGWDVDISYSR